MPRSLLRIRRSARAFARAPSLSFGLLLAIALGVGSNAAVYGFLQGLIKPATPLRSSDRIVSIFRQDRFRDAESLSPNEYQLLENRDGVFEWIGAARIKLTDAMIGGRSEIATVAAVTDNLAEAVAIPLDNGVVISHRIWESEFGSRENAVGSDIRIDNVDFRISGVAPKHFDGLYNDQSIDLWIQTKRQNLEDARDGRDLFVIARLRSGVSLSQAQTILRSGSAGLSEVSLTPFTGIAPNITRGLTRIGLFLNFAAAAVFFIACINVASFLLGRALKRSHDTSLRMALGATRAELLRDLFADSVVISIAGGVMGLLLGILTARTLPVLLFQDDAERLSFAPRLIPILTASMVCIVITVICGMMPVLGTMTDRPWIVLKRESGSPSKAIQSLRSALVVGQITVCCILVICTALLLNGLHSALVTSAGHRLGDPVLLTVQARTLPEVDFNYFSEVEQRAKSVAGLSPLAWTAQLPGNQPTWRAFRIQQPSPQYGDVAMDIAWLTPDSLQLLENPPIAGRMFGFKDQGHRVAVVDEEAAAQLFGRQTVGIVILDSTDLPIEIIGVVKRKANGARQQRRPTIYYGFVDQSAAPRAIRDAPFRVPLVPPTGSIELNANVVSAIFRGAGHAIDGRKNILRRSNPWPRTCGGNQSRGRRFLLRW